MIFFSFSAKVYDAIIWTLFNFSSDFQFSQTIQMAFQDCSKYSNNDLKFLLDVYILQK